MTNAYFAVKLDRIRALADILSAILETLAEKQIVSQARKAISEGAYVKKRRTAVPLVCKPQR